MKHKPVPVILTVFVTLTCWGILGYDLALDVGALHVTKKQHDSADTLATFALIALVVYFVVTFLAYWGDDD